MRPCRLSATGVLSLALLGCASASSSDDASGTSPPSIGPAGAESTDAPTLPSSSTSTVAVDVPVASTVPSELPRPAATNALEVEDGSFASLGEMAEAADLIVVGDVTELASLGRPNLDEDPYADEYLAVTIRTSEMLQGEPTDEIVLGWDAFGFDAGGNRVFTLTSNGVLPPNLGDRMLLFLVRADPGFVEHLSGAPTHQPVALDGVLELAGDQVIASEDGSPAAGMSLAAIRSAIRP